MFLLLDLPIHQKKRGKIAEAGRGKRAEPFH